MKKLFYLLFATILFSQNITAQIKSWNGSVSTDWNNSANWTPSGGSPAGVPIATDEVIINSKARMPLITSGSAVARTISLNTTTTLGISAGVTLTVVNPAGVGITMGNSTLTNAGTIIVTDNNSTYVNGQSAFNLNTGATVNNTGSITINGTANEGLRMAEGNFNNVGTVVTNGYNCIRLANANAIFTNSSGATLSGTGSTLSLNVNGGNFNNSGNVDFTGNCEIYVASSSITNLACGKFRLIGIVFIQTTSSIANAGYFYVSGAINVGSSSMSNTGVLKYGSVSGSAILNSGNGSVIVKDTPTPIFTYGGSFNGTINGIFTDANAINSAGTFTAPNTFAPAGLPGGSQTLYAKITPNGGACFYVVPFIYVAPTPAPTFTTPPSNMSVCTSVATSFSVVATNATSYQWQISTNSGGTWANVVASSIYTNVTTATLNISNPTGLGGNQYRCVATGVGGSTNSNAATLTIVSQCTIKSIATGNWTSPSIWNAGRVPQAGDNVIIDTPHTVTLSGISSVKNLEQKGVLSLSTTNSRVDLGL
jgi:trimeric autotransporter adhesin